jgi:hypothetical protein
LKSEVTSVTMIVTKIPKGAIQFLFFSIRLSVLKDKDGVYPQWL